MDDRDAIHIVIPTHTTRYLDLALISVARQSVKPATVTVTCDVVDTRIDSLLNHWADRLALTIRYVRRVRQGPVCISQVRNNAVRALIRAGYNTGRILILDGDTCLSPGAVEQHQTFGRLADMVLVHRIDLSQAQTRAITPDRLLSGDLPLTPTSEQMAVLNRLHRKALLHAFLRRYGLTKAHKPKLLGGHHSVSFEMFRKVNGHDEQYHSWGSEDDDFARRVYQAGGKSTVAIRDILVYHLWHETRAPVDWHDHENANRFKRRDLPVFCESGLVSPLKQGPVLEDVIPGHATPAH